ncbi:hypothetical protein [Halobaculum magnesiiphilum]|nr:hypothetical protein [Halobaculum magnesiiphilum]
MSRASVMLGVRPVTRTMVNERRGSRTQDQYLQHLMKIEEEREG